MEINILAFDPGLTTGIAHFRDTTFVMGMIVNEQQILDGRFLFRLVEITHPDHVLIEQPPAAAKFHVEAHHAITSHLLHWFTTSGFEVTLIKPAQWKGLTKSLSISTIHIRDAANMANWFIANHG